MYVANFEVLIHYLYFWIPRIKIFYQYQYQSVVSDQHDADIPNVFECQYGLVLAVTSGDAYSLKSREIKLHLWWRQVRLLADWVVD